jgi:hypothetical protein
MMAVMAAAAAAVDWLTGLAGWLASVPGSRLQEGVPAGCVHRSDSGCGDDLSLCTVVGVGEPGAGAGPDAQGRACVSHVAVIHVVCCELHTRGRDSESSKRGPLSVQRSSHASSFHTRFYPCFNLLRTHLSCGCWFVFAVP